MGNIVSFLKAIRTLLGYLLVATLIVSPVGIYFLLCGFGCFIGSQYCLRVWFSLDVLACSTIHGTRRRTISGYVGERIHIRRFFIVASIIDWLALRCGDGPNHCVRAYEWERRTLNL